MKLPIKTAPMGIVLPAVLTLVLFVITIFIFILPVIETNLMDRKREMIRELTITAVSAIKAFAAKQASGELSLEQAQQEAIAHLRQWRYGSDAKDYFWINDTHPHIIMHPYRPDLEGRDISDYADPTGKRLFVEFVNVVRSQGAGYVDYQWQWQDKADKIVPKISYVMGFEPWDWIVGTGIYVEDVRQEIAALTRKLTYVCLAITGLVIVLTAFIIRQGVKVAQERLGAESQAIMQQEQLFQAAKMASVGTLVSGVAHEINNPIASVMLNVPVIKKYWQASQPVMDAHVRARGDIVVGRMPYTQLRERIPLIIDSIEDSTQRVKTIVSDLKDFSRQSPAEMIDEIDVNHSLEKAVGLITNLIKKSTQNFHTYLAPGLPLVRGNAQRIEQVLINLLVNACQALDHPGQAITVATGYMEDEGEVVIDISDEGTGIPAEVLSQIKDPFFTTKRETGGTGLGLAISDKIIQDHGGRMVFESTHNVGTAVRISLPVTQTPNSEV